MNLDRILDRVNKEHEKLQIENLGCSSPFGAPKESQRESHHFPKGIPSGRDRGIARLLCLGVLLPEDLQEGL